MANVIKPLRRTGSAGVPNVANMQDGEIAVNAFEKKVFMRVGDNLAEIANASEGLPPGGNTGQVLTKLSDISGDVGWLPGSGGGVSSVANIPIDTVVGNYTFVASDRGRAKAKYATGNATYTLNNGVFEAGDIFSVANFSNSGLITITRGSGVSLFLVGTSNNANRRVGTSGGFATILMATPSTGYVFGMMVG